MTLMRPYEGSATQLNKCEVHRNREDRDPGDIGDDDIHREIAPDEKYPVAQPDVGRDCLGRDEVDPRRAERQAQSGDESRQRLGQCDAECQLPAAGTQCLRLDELFLREG